MAYASRSGRARTSPSNPQAFGVCQRCGIWYNRINLRNQYDWRGSGLLPLYIFVCNDCYDVPQEQLRAIVIPADPVPIKFPLPEPFTSDEVSNSALFPSTTDPTTGIPIPFTTNVTTVGGTNVNPEPIGRPVGLFQQSIPPLQTVGGGPAQHFDVVVPVLSVTANGTDTINVTCSAPHGLATNAQVSVLGLSTALASGFYSVVVTTATAFTYQVYSQSIPAGSLLTSDTRIVTTLIGLPLGWSTIPQVGP